MRAGVITTNGSLLRSDTTASAMSFDVIRVQEQTIMPAPPIGARESPRTKPQTNVHPAPLGCCSFNATRQKETAQRPERRLPQCAVRRGLDLGREASVSSLISCRESSPKKSPGRIWRGEFIAGTENARLPRVPQPLL